MNRLLFLGALLWLGTFSAPIFADDWPMLGRDKTRNPVSADKNPPRWWQLDTGDEGPKRRQNIKWVAPLGYNSTCNPAIANGLVWIGAIGTDNNREKRLAVLNCFREKDGKLLYQYRTARDEDSDRLNHTSTPLIEGDRIWFVTERSEVVCLDIAPLQRGDGQPRPKWKVDMVKDLGIYPSKPWCFLQDWKRCSIGASYRDRIFVCTGHGPPEEGVPSDPIPPSLVCLHKDTGKVLWKDNSPGKNIVEGQWGNPLVIEINGRGQVIVPQGDGWLRSFDAMTGKLIWKFDPNPRNVRPPFQKALLMATPVYYGGRIYVGNGESTTRNRRTNCSFYCIDPTKQGDISPEIDDGAGLGKANPNSGLIWKRDGMREGRRVFDGTFATAAISNDLVIVAESNGYLTCLDARTGKAYWRYDSFASFTAAPLVIDGRIYVGTEDGEIHVVALGKDLVVERRLDMEDAIRTAPVFANGVLYVATRSKLYAIAGNDQPDKALAK